MKTLNTIPTQKSRSRSAEAESFPHVERVFPRIENQAAPRALGNLVESEDFEWISPCSLPGLIVRPTATRPIQATSTHAQQRSSGEVFETEDGDATGVCQLPGGLAVGYDPTPVQVERITLASHDDLQDEYAESAAMQLPGRLVALQGNESASRQPAEARGLCASCTHDQTCDFPRPAGGVWRCEEYA